MDKEQPVEPSQLEPILCVQCGQEIPPSTWIKRRERNKDKWDYCRDCTAKPAKSVRTTNPILGELFCTPHTGELDDLWRPINAKGELFLPGLRMCGMKDCVNRNHIVGQTHKKTKPKKITDFELLLTMIEVQDYNRRTRTR